MSQRACLTWRRTRSTPRPARTNSPLHVPGRRLSRATESPPPQRRLSATRTILQAGARLAATRPVPAARARSTSTATGGSLKPTIDDGRQRTDGTIRCLISFVRYWSLVPGAEAAVEAAGGHRRRRAAEQARSVSRIFLRLGVLFRRGGFGCSRIRGFGLCRWRLGLRPGCAGGALPTLRGGGGGVRFRRRGGGGARPAGNPALGLR